MSGVILRIFSGLHIGAEIALEAGTWVIGSDDSCDIILSEKSIAPRHSTFTVNEDGSVDATPLDGQIISIDTDEVIDHQRLVQAHVYKLADVLFAIGPDSANASFWDNIARSLSAVSVEKPVAASPEPVTESQASAEQSESTSEESSSEKTPSDTENSEKSASAAPRKKWLLVLLALLSGGIVAAGLGLSLSSKDTGTTQKVDQSKELTEIIKDAGFADVKVSVTPANVIVLSGSVRDDAERGRLVKLSRLLKQSVALSVSVDSDYTEPLRKSFNSFGIWPRITLEKEKNTKVLHILSYIRTNIIEEEIFEQAVKNVPYLMDKAIRDTVTIKRHIRYQPDIHKTLSETFSKHNLTGVKVDYLPGRILLQTKLTPDLRVRLDQAITELMSKTDVPLEVDFENTAVIMKTATPSASAASMPATVSVPSVPEDPLKPKFRVVSTSGGILKFVTLSTGEKIFEGGKMPGGFILKSISDDKLQLLKNNTKIVYPLRRIK